MNRNFHVQNWLNQSPLYTPNPVQAPVDFACDGSLATSAELPCLASSDSGISVHDHESYQEAVSLMSSCVNQSSGIHKERLYSGQVSAENSNALISYSPSPHLPAALSISGSSECCKPQEKTLLWQTLRKAEEVIHREPESHVQHRVPLSTVQLQDVMESVHFKYVSTQLKFS